MSRGGTEAEGALPGACQAAESEGTVPKATLASDITCKFRDFSETTFSFNSSLEGLQISLKFVTLMAMVYYMGKVKLVRGILTGDRVQGFPNTRLPLSSEGDSLPASICDNVYGLLTTRETGPPKLWRPEIFLGLHYIGRID